MKKIEQKIVRFYSDNPDHQKAFDILQHIDSDKYSSVQNFIITAINMLGELDANEDDAVNEKKTWEDPLVERICDAVEKIINERLTQVVISYLIGIQTGQTSNSLLTTSSTDLMMTSKVEDTKTESEDEIEKDHEANEMLDLDAFF